MIQNLKARGPNPNHHLSASQGLQVSAQLPRLWLELWQASTQSSQQASAARLTYTPGRPAVPHPIPQATTPTCNEHFY